jgi:Transposase DDE domain
MVGTVMEALRHIKAELATLLDAPAILTLCHALGYQWRVRLLDPVTTVHLFILQILHSNTACSHLPRLVGQHFTASAFCQARTRLPLGIWQQLLRRTAAVCEQTTHDEGRWRGHRTFLVDGSSFSMPDTPELQEYFGQPHGQRPGCGFPVAHLLALFHAGTGFLLEVLATPWHTHDMAQVATLHAALRPEDVLVGDRAFCSFIHLALLCQQGLHAVWRVHQKQIVDFTPARPHTTPKASNTRKGLPRSRWLRQLGVTDQLVEWVKPVRLPVHPPAWMTPELFAALPEVLCVRELRYRIIQAGFRTQTVTLVTTLLEVDLYPADTLAELYHMRWQVETNLRHLKQTMGLDVLHCQRLVGVLKELTVFALLYNLVRVVMLEAAKRQGVALERISFIDALRWLSTARPGEPLPPLVVNPHRPDRVEPRAVKRRPKPYPLLTKPRREARKALIQQSVGA